MKRSQLHIRFARKQKLPRWDLPRQQKWFSHMVQSDFKNMPMLSGKYLKHIKLIYLYSYNFRKVCEVLMVLTYGGASCVFIVLIASSFQGVINNQLAIDWNIRIYIAFAVIACLFVGQIRLLKYLVPCSIVANVLIMSVLGITFYITLDQPIDYDHRNKFTSWAELPGFFSIVIFAMEGVGTIMPIENQMKNPKHFLGWCGVLNCAMIVVVGLYTTIGYLGYMRFGDDVKGSITLNLPLDNV